MEKILTIYIRVCRIFLPAPHLSPMGLWCPFKPKLNYMHVFKESWGYFDVYTAENVCKDTMILKKNFLNSIRSV